MSNKKKNKDVLIMIDGESETFKRVSKGDRIKTKDGYYIACETGKENMNRWDQNLLESEKKSKRLNGKLEKEVKKSTKLDFKTWLYLYITHAVRIEHPPVIDIEDKRTMYVKDSKKNEVYVFRDHDEYKNYFLMYLDSIEEDVIDLAIYTRGSKGQIIALKELCEHIIVKKKMNDFYSSITQEKIDKIHAKGKLTPLEAVQMWESFDLCVEGSKSVFSKSRCQYFDYKCHECLMESASHKLEHDPIEFELVNSTKEEQGPVKKLVPNKK